MRRKESTHKCINKVLNDLAEFGVIVEVDPKTFEVLGVGWPKEKPYFPPLGSIK
jgi:hypothetical protein